MSNEESVTRFVAGLRALADWYEEHPDAPMPYDPTIVISAQDTEAEAVRLARLLGTSRKEYSSDYFTLTRDFGGVKIRYLFHRSAVCTKRVLRVEDVPERVTPAYTREVVEWDCHPLLAESSGA